MTPDLRQVRWVTNFHRFSVIAGCRDRPPEIWQERRVLSFVVSIHPITTFKQSGEVLQILSSFALTYTRLGLHPKDKAWIYNKYQEGAALLLTFPAAGKSKCPLRRQEAADIIFNIKKILKMKIDHHF